MNDLIKRLRAKETAHLPGGYKLCAEAADALEQMKAMVIVEAQHTEMFDERDKQTLIEMAKSLPLQIIPNKDEKPRWISVTEKLPESGKVVIGYNGKRRFVAIVRVSRDSINLITHWMPLPDFPEPQKGEQGNV